MTQEQLLKPSYYISFYGSIGLGLLASFAALTGNLSSAFGALGTGLVLHYLIYSKPYVLPPAKEDNPKLSALLKASSYIVLVYGIIAIFSAFGLVRFLLIMLNDTFERIDAVFFLFLFGAIACLVYGAAMVYYLMKASNVFSLRL